MRFGISQDGFVFALALPFLFSLHVAIGARWLRFRRSREISVRIFDWAVWFAIWKDPMGGWSSRDGWWQRREWNWHFLDTLLGKFVYSEREIEKVRVEIPMPEASYPATITMSEAKRKRSRWFARYIVRADIQPDKPVPFPGKGENSWDCGEDATHSMSMPARNAEDAIGKFVTSVLRSRCRNGSRKWRPAA